MFSGDYGCLRFLCDLPAQTDTDCFLRTSRAIATSITFKSWFNQFPPCSRFKKSFKHPGPAARLPKPSSRRGLPAGIRLQLAPTPTPAFASDQARFVQDAQMLGDRGELSGGCRDIVTPCLLHTCQDRRPSARPGGKDFQALIIRRYSARTMSTSGE